jgi:site-specific recombinase XerD
MLESYYVRPQAVDRIRASWIGSEIERYVGWLAEQSYSRASVRCRVPVLFAFGEFARAGGARSVGDLPAHVEAFVAERIPADRAAELGAVAARGRVKNVRGPIEQMLGLVVPGFTGSRRPLLDVPFSDELPGFCEYLVCERGLRPTSVQGYECYLRSFERYLGRVGVKQLVELSPALISGFIAERSRAGLAKASVGLVCGALRGFLRYAHRQGVLAGDLSKTVDRPRTYRLSDIPRSISRAEVSQVLACVDRSSSRGKRDYAALLLLATYGLRSREVAAMTLDHIDWTRERLSVPGRKAGHSTACPLSSSVGDALVDYLMHGRPQSAERQVFFMAFAPVRPISPTAVSKLATKYLLKAGIQVSRPGSHTLRHSCVQRLVDADFSLKTIGDFVGHRSPKTTEIYTKVAVESLRELALGDGEAVLA